MIERSGLCQIKALNLPFSKNNATPILKAPTVYMYIYMYIDIYVLESLLASLADF